MVRIDFPLELTSPAFQDSLIRENPEDFITKVRMGRGVGWVLLWVVVVCSLFLSDG